MFSGIGAPEIAMQRVFPDAISVGYSEIDKFANQVMERRFPNVKNYGDATTINSNELPDFDLLIGGFPCQAFSVAGKRLGFEDTRGTLFFDVARILRDKRPRYFILENVKGLLSHDSGKTFQTILEVLSDAGYGVSWSIHNSKNYGVPQNRERIYLIGNLRGERRPQVFPIIGADSKDTRIIGQDVAYTIDANYSKGTNTLEKSRRSVVQAVLTPDRAEKRQNGRRMKENGEPAFTVTSQDQHGVYDGASIRRLTPTECLRLQGFPDGWNDNVSETQQYKQAGNAMTVNVVEHILRELNETL